MVNWRSFCFLQPNRVQRGFYFGLVTCTMIFKQPLPLSLYIHYPWCVQKCPYCDFNSHTLGQDQEQRYLQALIKQLELALPSIWGRPIESIFFGGGTPSLLSEQGLDWLLSQLRARLGFSPQIEITLEANPGTVDFNKFAGFYQAGINRLSIGIQSFSDQKLAALGRIHSGNEAQQAILAAKQAGFNNFNLDLMFALPNQTLDQALTDLETALSFEPTHLSHYQLTLEPNTPFYKNPPRLPDDDLAWDIQLACQARLAEEGYQHYEVSAYAQPNFRAQHNLNYWQFGDYLGLGAGAHGKITQAPLGQIWRTQMPASPGRYMEMVEAATDEQGLGRMTKVDSDEAMFEFMLNLLRLTEGFSIDLFAQRTGLDWNQVADQVGGLQQKKWLTLTENNLKLTPLGQTFLNEVLHVFLTD